MSRLICCVLALGLCSSNAAAQGDAMIELYGEGVHRYYSGDYLGANQLFSEVIDAGSMDPRVYFFRGLTQEMQGGDGLADYEVGARLEAEGPLSVDVGGALIRIQGATRTKIEEERREARVVALQQKMSEEAQRASEMPEEPPADIESAAPIDSDVPDLLSGDEGLRSDATTTDEEQPDMALPEDATTNPFGDDPTPPPTAETPNAAGAADNPFGTAAGDANDPFGTSGGDAPAADPFGTPGGAGDDAGADDPFGTPSGGTDPFGTSGGDADAADPFGTGN